MPRRSSPGQRKISRRPTASDRARRQRTRRMQAESLDTQPFTCEKPTSSTTPDPLVPGQSGDVSEEIGTSTTKTKMSIQQYQQDIQLEPFQVNNQPQFLESDTEMTEIDQVKGIFQ